MKASPASLAASFWLLAALVLPGGAFAAPSVTVSKPCYREDRSIDVSGSGFTPGGVVNVTLDYDGQQTTYPLMADGSGNIAINLRAPMVEGRPPTVLTAVDTARVAQGAPPAESSTTASFLITDWSVTVPGFARRSWRPGARTPVTATGWAHAVGQTLYAHYTRAGKRRFSQRIGELAPPCGDLYASMRMYRSPVRATYRVYLDASAVWPNNVEGRIFTLRPRGVFSG